MRAEPAAAALLRAREKARKEVNDLCGKLSEKVKTKTEDLEEACRRIQRFCGTLR